MTATIRGETLIELHQLLGHYCHILDARAWHRLPELFAPQAILDAGSVGMGVHRGIDAISALWQKVEHPIAHHVSAIVARQGETGVEIVSKGFFAWPDGLTGGDHRDTAVFTEGGWRLASRCDIRRWSLRTGGHAP